MAIRRLRDGWLQAPDAHACHHLVVFAKWECDIVIRGIFETVAWSLAY